MVHVMHDLEALVDHQLRDVSGSVLYSGHEAFSRPSRLYVLGLMPGGSPAQQSAETVGVHLRTWLARPQARWSEFLDESWGGAPPGTARMQKNMLHLLAGLGLDPREVPASNVVFVRAHSEADLTADRAFLAQACWPVHRAVMARLEVDTVLCLGGTAGAWVRERLCAERHVREFRETNARGWTSTTHAAASGVHVITVTSPNRAVWTNPAADPTDLVRASLDRGV